MERGRSGAEHPLLTPFTCGNFAVMDLHDRPAIAAVSPMRAVADLLQDPIYPPFPGAVGFCNSNSSAVALIRDFSSHISRCYRISKRADIRSYNPHLLPLRQQVTAITTVLTTARTTSR